MYTLLIKGRTYDELKQKLEDLYINVFNLKIEHELPDAVDCVPTEQPQEPVFLPEVQAPPVAETAPPSLPEPSVAPTAPAPEVAAPQPALDPGGTLVDMINNPELDSKGLPWDKRIHAASKAKVKDGSWRTRRNLDPEVLRQIENELRTRPVSTQPITPPAVPPTTVDVQPPVFSQPAPQVVEPTPPPVAPPIAQPTVQPVQQVAPQVEGLEIPPGIRQAHTLATFQAHIVNIFAQLQKEGKITPEYIKQLEQHFGVDHIWGIMKYPEKVQQLYDNFCEYGFITRVD